MNLDTSQEETSLIMKITDRAMKLYANAGVKADRISIELDITACHCNGTPMRLQDWADTKSDFDLIHDVQGISNHISRKTGQLNGHFLPRFAKPQREEG
jgi:hypothetical protein